MRGLTVSWIADVWDRRPRTAQVRWPPLARRLSRRPPVLSHLDARGCSVEQLRARLREQMPQRRHLVDAAPDARLAGLAKGQLPAWIPVRLSAPERVARAVVDLHLLVLDFDEGDIDASWAHWRRYAAQLHTTWSHADDAPRWRIVLPLAQPVPRDDWRRVHAWACAQPGGRPDGQACDPIRLYYLPALRSEASPWRSEISEGPWVAPPLAELRSRERQRQEAARRRAHLRAEAARYATRQRSSGPSERDERRLLATCPDARRAHGVARGGRIHTTTAGELIRGVPCPGCSRPDVWWAIEPGRGHYARCNHRRTCGWAGPLWGI